MTWLGLDIGGANLKAADGLGFARSHNFPLWQRPAELPQALRALIAEAPATERIAATMTGELADCFATKADGVTAILDAITEAADGRHTRIYLNNGKFVTPLVAQRHPEQAAASNWHAMATLAIEYLGESKTGMLIDVGSTTTDLIPLTDSQATASGSTDTERLIAGELVYTGFRRSPVCAVAPTVPYRSQDVPVAAEVFATTHDVHLLLGHIAEDAADTNTADGRPATKRFARQRMARMICADQESFHHRDAVVMAQSIAAAQVHSIVRAAKKSWKHATPPPIIVVCGDGESLAMRVIDSLGWPGTRVSLRKQLGTRVSTCGPAHAVAVLARRNHES